MPVTAFQRVLSLIKLAASGDAIDWPPKGKPDGRRGCLIHGTFRQMAMQPLPTNCRPRHALPKRQGRALPTIGS